MRKGRLLTDWVVDRWVNLNLFKLIKGNDARKLAYHFMIHKLNLDLTKFMQFF